MTSTGGHYTEYTGYGWEGLRQVSATLLGARHDLSASAVVVSILMGAITNALLYLFHLFTFSSSSSSVTSTGGHHGLHVGLSVSSPTLDDDCQRTVTDGARRPVTCSRSAGDLAT